MQKFVFRSALRPNQISFSHSQDPLQTSPRNQMQRDVNAQTRTTRCKERQTKGPDTRDDGLFTSRTLIGVLRLIETLVVYVSGFRKDHKFHLIAHLLQEVW